jgi:hypothetical protein
MEVSKVDMPVGAHIIRVAGLDGALWLWAIVDTDPPLETRTFHLFKTGGELPEDIINNYNFIGFGAIFIQMELMLYVFEKIGSASPTTPQLPQFDWKQVQETSNDSQQH